MDIVYSIKLLWYRLLEKVFTLRYNIATTIMQGKKNLLRIKWAPFERKS